MLDEKVIMDRIHNMTTSEAIAILHEVLMESGLEENCDVDGIYFEGLTPNEYVISKDFVFTFGRNGVLGIQQNFRYNSVDVDYKNSQLLEINSLPIDENFNTNRLVALAA